MCDVFTLHCVFTVFYFFHYLACLATIKIIIHNDIYTYTHTHTHTQRMSVSLNCRDCFAASCIAGKCRHGILAALSMKFDEPATLEFAEKRRLIDYTEHRIQTD